MKLVLEQINLRMGTVQDFGDIVTSITPIVSVIKGMRSSISGILPEANSEMSEIGEMMNGLIADAGQFGGSSPLIESSSAETTSILAEAAAVAEVNNEKNSHPHLHQQLLHRLQPTTFLNFKPNRLVTVMITHHSNLYQPHFLVIENAFITVGI